VVFADFGVDGLDEALDDAAVLVEGVLFDGLDGAAAFDAGLLVCLALMGSDFGPGFDFFLSSPSVFSIHAETTRVTAYISSAVADAARLTLTYEFC